METKLFKSNFKMKASEQKEEEEFFRKEKTKDKKGGASADVHKLRYKI